MSDLRAAALTLLALRDDGDRDHPRYARDVAEGYDALRAALAADTGTDREALARVKALLPTGPRPSVGLHSIGAWDFAQSVRAAIDGTDGGG